jgi:hypothetical protein
VSTKFGDVWAIPYSAPGSLGGTVFDSIREDGQDPAERLKCWHAKLKKADRAVITYGEPYPVEPCIVHEQGRPARIDRANPSPPFMRLKCPVCHGTGWMRA